ncbi:transcriptional pleiotropic repressor [Acetoanaerobium noterae]|jgi:transcriptional pleiotropic repressor|uniref:Global transcriptional regulator CodY n=2 Tax=Acetoanaerobium TaxID=186831 RepID=E3PRW3_ACESD|nr:MULTISPECIES: GTP-sensing pleiotropic transcriptional regulator CodY [Acetoanaerobium]MBP8762669.1 GTP-sensing pleiotropic transcriptional regulator CodY [Acetoanaerobium sp.]MDK2803338.1 transcriptional pleiotropic repressor [Peptostreptococcaceae bacterium]MBP9499465.1 GTP-sensing pleiotropic transcriptional regulator CodY [Acetoanaerobium sp.]MBP9562310.1 GTP-sensing pleiotropic transcriptional regulator CodY [Acetoanaerobium sp.]CBH21617.1 GTP-sensing transcriptional pleiotropic repress
MSSLLLEKTRKINKILQNSGSNPVSFTELSKTLKDVLNANVYIVSSKGKALGVELTHMSDSSTIIDEKTGEERLPDSYIESVNRIFETISNLTQEKLLEVFKDDVKSYEKYATIVPIMGSGQRLGTLILSRYESKFSDEDLILAEYSATVVGLEILRARSEELEDEMRSKAVVQMAINTLSYSELEAVEHIFNELNGDEGLLVASKIADRVGITRSVIVNALRKFESAGVIESRSLGMKGTHIKILNDKLLDELKKNKH